MFIKGYIKLNHLRVECDNAFSLVAYAAGPYRDEQNIGRRLFPWNL